MTKVETSFFYKFDVKSRNKFVYKCEDKNCLVPGRQLLTEVRVWCTWAKREGSEWYQAANKCIFLVTSKPNLTSFHPYPMSNKGEQAQIKEQSKKASPLK